MGWFIANIIIFAGAGLYGIENDIYVDTHVNYESFANDSRLLLMYLTDSDANKLILVIHRTMVTRHACCPEC